MRRTALLILIFAAALGACQSVPMQKIQQAVHPCPPENPWNIAWSPDGKKIAYWLEGRASSALTIANVDARSKTHVIDMISIGPVQWSPDGSQLLTYTQSGKAGLIGADGTGVRYLTEIMPYASTEWSPDGSKIAYLAYAVLSSKISSDIFILNLAKRESTRVFSGGMIGSVDWSPDGTRIALTQEIRPAPSELIVINADGSNPRQLVEDEHTGAGIWSPDSQQIAFLNGSDGTRLIVINADGTGWTALSDLAGWPFVWLPDGSGVIAYHSSDQNLDGNDGNIVRVDLDGHNTILANIAKYAPQWPPAFSPDGTKIAFIRMDAPYPDLYVMNVDGTDLVRLTHNPGYNTCFDWPF